MTRRAACIALGLSALLFAQEGHPLTGTWSGDWGPSVTERTHLTFVMSWDGKKVSGVMNPGPNSVVLGDVAIDFSNWTVRIQANGIAAEGQLEDLASSHRTIKGTWRQGTVSGDFRLTRD